MRKVADIMSYDVVAVAVGTSIQDVCKTLRKNNVSGVPVLDPDGNLTGYLSEKNIIGAVCKSDFLKKRAGDIMVKKVVSVKEDADVEQISRLFCEYSIRNIPVTRGGKVIGNVSRKDIISGLLGTYY